MDKNESIALRAAAAMGQIDSLIAQLDEISQDLEIAAGECEDLLNQGVINLALLPKALSRAANEAGYHSRNLNRLLDLKLSAIG